MSILRWLALTFPDRPGSAPVAFTYGVFVVHDLVFLLVVGADLLGRFAVAAVIVRARAIAADLPPRDGKAPEPQGVE